MRSSYRLLLGLLIAGLLSGCAATDPRFQPVTSARLAYLGVRVQAPGVSGWTVHEERRADSWFVIFKTTDPGNPMRTRFVSLQAGRLTPAEKEQFVREGGLQAFATLKLGHGRSTTSSRFKVLESDFVPDRVNGIDAIRGKRIVDEHDNPHFRGTVLRTNNTYYFLLHPGSGRVLVAVHASTREPRNDVRLTSAPLADSFIKDMSFY